MIHSTVIFVTLFCYMQGHAAKTSDTCEKENFSAFNMCLAKKLQNNAEAKKLEEEWYNDSLMLANKCFDKPDAKQKRNCVLDKGELEADAFGSKGPMKDCVTCQKIARDMKTMYFQTSNSQRQCLQNHLINVIYDQIAPCVQNRSKEANISKIFDFANDTFKNTDIELRTMNLQVLVNNRFDVCSIMNGNRSENSKQCLAHGSDKGALYKEHCRAIKQCKNDNVPRQCQTKFEQLYNGTCDCYANVRREWHDRAEEIYVAIFNSSDFDDCTRHLFNAFGIWKERFQLAINDCVRVNKPLTTVEKMIQLGCVQVLSMDDDHKRGMLAGFRLLRNLLDAMSDHVMRFCRSC